MKKRKPLSELQKANLLTGILLRRCYNTSSLVMFLREEGHSSLANHVESALQVGRAMARAKGKLAVARARTKKALGESNEDDCPF